MIPIDWTYFKAYVDSNAISFKEISYTNNYYLYLSDGGIVAVCNIVKDGGSDQTDYEANYRSSKANKQILRTSQIHKSFSVTTQQTNATIWTPASGKRIILTGYQFSLHNNTLVAQSAQLFEDTNTAANILYTNFTATGSNFDVSHVLTPAVPLAVDKAIKATTSGGIRVAGVLFGYEV